MSSDSGQSVHAPNMGPGGPERPQASAAAGVPPQPPAVPDAGQQPCAPGGSQPYGGPYPGSSHLHGGAGMPAQVPPGPWNPFQQGPSQAFPGGGSPSPYPFGAGYSTQPIYGIPGSWGNPSYPHYGNYAVPAAGAAPTGDSAVSSAEARASTSKGQSKPWDTLPGDGKVAGPLPRRNLKKATFVEDLDTCAICYAKKKDMRVLQPCGHFPFCLDCIKSSTRGSPSMRCSQCRKQCTDTITLQKVKPSI